MEQGGMLLPLGILCLGIAGIAGFMAFRPWPVGSSTGTSIKPGTYAVEILSGHAPAASSPPDRKGQVQAIEGGLATLLALWGVKKLAGTLPVSGTGGGTGPAGEPEGEQNAGSEIESDVENATETLEGDV
jgi:hypothetical protein